MIVRNVVITMIVRTVVIAVVVRIIVVVVIGIVGMVVAAIIWMVVVAIISMIVVRMVSVAVGITIAHRMATSVRSSDPSRAAAHGHECNIWRFGDRMERHRAGGNRGYSQQREC
jgi:hypothetical protein